MKIFDKARCPDCKDSLGTPREVAQEDGDEYTLYECNSCGFEWLRPHS